MPLSALAAAPYPARMHLRVRAARVCLAVWLCTPGCERHGTHGPASNESHPREMLAVAAAADLAFAFGELASAFQRREPGLGLRVTFGSSGSFFAQLVNDAPFDVFLSADADYPTRLVAAGLVEPGSEFVYAVGRLVVWAPTPARRESAANAEAVLRDPRVGSIALANPAHAPYGRAAESVLKHLGVYERVRDRLVFGENVAQAAQFVESGAADIGLIARSLAVAPAMQAKGRYWDVPADAHPPLVQTGVVPKRARHPTAAAHFREFILSADARTILQRHGFDPPSE